VQQLMDGAHSAAAGTIQAREGAQITNGIEAMLRGIE
jgi:X-X-X-Leu-X-X-Gly heptad repeat protein